jgi:UDP-glucose 4-epimerase
VPTTYLVTGGAGFIGSHLVDALLARNDRVIALDNLATGRLRNLDSASNHPNFRFVHGSVLDALVVDELVREADCIVHLAAAVGVKLIIEQPLRSFITNIRGTEIVLDAAHRYRRKILLASTSEVYGKNNSDALDESADRLMGSTSIARWAYSTAKTVDEVLGFAYHKERGLDVVIARFFNTVGPRQTAAYGMVIPTLVDQAVVGAPLTVHGSGRQTRCFCHVLDTVQAVLALLGDERASGDVFNVGSSDEIAIDELARRIVATADSASVVRLVPYAEVYERDFEDMLRRVPDTGKLRALTGWRPTKTLTDILEESIQEARLEAAYAAADQR